MNGAKILRSPGTVLSHARTATSRERRFSHRAPQLIDLDSLRLPSNPRSGDLDRRFQALRLPARIRQQARPCQNAGGRPLFPVSDLALPKTRGQRTDPRRALRRKLLAQGLDADSLRAQLP